MKKMLRIFGMLFGVVAAVGMYSCGGSSQLAEFLGEGGPVVVGEFSASGGSTVPSASISSKDIIFGGATGTVFGTEGTSTEAGLLYCYFVVDSVSQPLGKVQVKGTPEACAGIQHCAYCVATEIDPDCDLECHVTVPADDGDMDGESIGWRYINHTNFWTDAEGPMDGAFSTQGLITIGDSNIDITIDSTNVTHSVDVNGTLAIDEVTILVDASNTVSFEHAFSVTDAVLDPDPSLSGNDDAPADVAWAIIEAAVPGKFHLDKLASSSGTIFYDPFEYYSNAAFYFDSASMGDLVSTVESFGSTYTLADYGITVSCVHPWENEGVDLMCLPIVHSTSGGIGELLITDASVTSLLMTEGAAYTDSESCTAADGDWGEDIGIGATICFAGGLLDVDTYPPGMGLAYNISDAYIIGVDKTLQEYKDAIFIRDGVFADNAIDISEACETDFGEYEAFLQDARVYGEVNTGSADCVEVASRFMADPAAGDYSLTGQFALEFNDAGALKVFFNDHAINVDHPQYVEELNEPRFGELQLFWDLTTGIDGDMLADIGAEGLSLGSPSWIYAHDGGTKVNGNVVLGWAGIQLPIGNELPNDFIISLVLLSDTGAADCATDGPLRITMQMVGNEVGTSSGCMERQLYSRSNGYMSDNSEGFYVEEPALEAMKTMFDVSTNVVAAADWVAGTDMTLVDMWQHCFDTHGANGGLVARPYEKNADKLPTADPIDDACRFGAQRFYSTPINPGDEGSDKRLTGLPLIFNFTNVGEETQGITIGTFQGAATSPKSVFNDITDGTCVKDDATPIPAAGNTFGADQWFDVGQRVSASTNVNAGARFKICMEDALPQDGFIGIQTSIDFHRIRENEVRDLDKGENVYLLILDLMEPVSVTGALGDSCEFDQQFRIDGTCWGDGAL